MDQSKTCWAACLDRGPVARAACAVILATLLIVSPLSQVPAAAFDLPSVTRLLGFGREAPAEAASTERAKPRDGRFVVSEADWSTFERVTVAEATFREQVVTEGRLAIDENSATPVISPYSGRTTRITALPGDIVRRGQALLFFEANDMVQTQNDFIAAISALDKAQTQLRLAEINARRQEDLLAGRAAPQRDVDQARADLDAARADHRAAVTALEAVENRLRLFGKSDADIQRFRAGRRIDPEVALLSPIEGTVVSRKIGPGQFITGGAGDPIFVIDDLDTLWLNAYVREDEAPKVARGALIEFRVLAFRDRVFVGRLDFVAPSIDAGNRRLLVRATVENPDRELKQQMFANVAIQVGDPVNAPAVPRNAIIYEGEVARIWVAHPDRSVELRRVTLGMIRGETVQIIHGVKLGEEVVVRGALFIDQMTAAFRR
ncbi:efflux RND transporter periplasmic adaptor subunit [Phreatobacter stygius]|uniref:Efflux RND transporter periplasmic adaptor subunit n=1 Tax=Phreatobacter stygius TaxID=1940610 RepID=A0A4D7B6A5_9HYPH|nr:efflux RND transporter periplasmic adaptor subunit [Phreatobacter stygius]QCI65720.1 efflux RND transporter periplasmic adaptor subunit [Phreatobacter stygius]